MTTTQKGRSIAPRTVTGRAMAILGAFSPEHPKLGLVQISDSTGIPRSTAHRLIAQLTDLGALQRNADLQYQIGPRFRDFVKASSE